MKNAIILFIFSIVTAICIGEIIVYYRLPSLTKNMLAASQLTVPKLSDSNLNALQKTLSLATLKDNEMFIEGTTVIKLKGIVRSVSVVDNNMYINLTKEIKKGVDKSYRQRFVFDLAYTTLKEVGGATMSASLLKPLDVVMIELSYDFSTSNQVTTIQKLP